MRWNTVMPGHGRLAEIRHEQDHRAALCYKCGRPATDRGGIIIVHDMHKLAEYKLRKALGYPAEDPTENLDYYNEEMEEATEGYVAYVLEQVEDAKQTCSDPVVLVEQRVDFSRWVKQGFGTADALIIADGTLRIIDLKYGLGVEVSAEHNPQMACYSLGALELFDDIYDIDTVSMTIYQPRRQNISQWQTPKADLLQWADETLKPAAEQAWDGKGEFSCGPWCRFCKAKTICGKRAEENLKLAQHEFRLPPELSDAEIEVILGKVDELVSWASDIKEYALQQALLGKEWRGFKLVEDVAGIGWACDAGRFTCPTCGKDHQH